MNWNGRTLALLLLALQLYTTQLVVADDDVWKAVAADIRKEQLDHEALAEELANDEQRAKQAETHFEALAQAAAEAQEEQKTQVKTEPKIGSTIKQESLHNHDNTRPKARERMPQRTRKNAFGDEFATEAKAPRATRTGFQTTAFQQELEELLNKDLEDMYAFEKQRKTKENPSKTQQKRLAVSRSYARPVEKMLEKLEKGSTFYDILGLKQTARPEDIKDAYRQLAKTLHPDKNPHPDARTAFDAIQDAYDMLINPSSRITYDNDLRRRPEPYKRYVRALSNNVENTYARSLLFMKRMRTGEWQTELRELKDTVTTLLAKLQAMLLTIAAQPSNKDKVLLLGEKAWDNKGKLAAVVSAMWVLFRRRK